MSSDVLAIKPLASSGRVQGFIGTGAGTATNLGPIRIKSIQAQSSAADAVIIIYDGTSASSTKIKAQFKFGSGLMNLLITTYQVTVLNLILVLLLH